MHSVQLMRGLYGVKPKLPAPVGSEGVARVAKVGSGVTGIKEGDRVLFPRGGNGNPLQYSCLENHMDQGAW